MQNLDNRSKSSGRFVISLCSKLGHFSQSNRRQKQQKEPCRTGDIPADIRPEKPCDSGNCQDNNRGDAAAVVGRAGPPTTSQREQRRNDSKEKKDVIEIQA